MPCHVVDVLHKQRQETCFEFIDYYIITKTQIVQKRPCFISLFCIFLFLNKSSLVNILLNKSCQPN